MASCDSLKENKDFPPVEFPGTSYPKGRIYGEYSFLNFQILSSTTNDVDYVCSAMLLYS